MSERFSDATPLRFPDFVGIGAQKAGTTWLHHNLRSHPAIWLPAIKELHYFNELYIPSHRKWTVNYRRKKAIQAFQYHIRSRSEEKWDYRIISVLTTLIEGSVSDQWYGKIFTVAGDTQLCGEITPDYSLLPRAGISHLMRLNPTMKIIVIFRDPIERSWSHIRMLIDQQPGLTFDGAWSFLDVRQRSDCSDILERWKFYCRGDQIFIGFTDHILSDPLSFLERVCEFLGVSFSASYFPEAHKRVYEGNKREMPAALYDKMRANFDPLYRNLAAQFPDPCRSWVEKHFS